MKNISDIVYILRNVLEMIGIPPKNAERQRDTKAA